MKKKLLLLITLLLSLFIYSGRVYCSQVMYMECEDGFSEFIAMITEGEENQTLKIGYLKLNDSGSGFGRFEFILGDRDNCWMTNAESIGDSCSVGENGIEQNFDINNRMCPQKMRGAYEGTFDVVFAGGLLQPKENSVSVIENNEYVFFKEKNNGEIYAESYYNVNGIYSHINNRKFDNEYQKNIIFGNNIKNGDTNYDCIDINKLKTKCASNPDFWKVAQNHDLTYFHSMCSFNDNCGDYDVAFDSSKNKYKLKNLINAWNEENKNSSFNENYSKFLSIVNDKKYILAVDKMIESYDKNGTYSFDDGYSPSQMFNKLKVSYEYLKAIYDNPAKFKNYDDTEKKYLSDAVESALQYTMKETIGKVTIKEYCESDKNFECLNISYLNRALYDDIKEYLNSNFGYSGDITILDLGSMNVLDGYTKKFLNAIAYFNKYSDSTDLSKDIKEKDLPELKKNITELGRIRDIFTVIDCEDLISDKLKEKLNSYYNFFKILISLALIGFGLLDFGKAIFEADENKMKESQTKFIKRILVVIILFLIPLLVKFILTIANAVWSNIYPGACGLF